MAGDTPEHAAPSVTVVGRLAIQLQGGPCRVYGPDLRIRVVATDMSAYPGHEHGGLQRWDWLVARELVAQIVIHG